MVPIGIAIWLIIYVWLYSSFFNKSIVMMSDIDSAWDCLQIWSFIGNTIWFYNLNLMKYSFQSCWKCHCCYRDIDKEDDDDGWDIENIQKLAKNKSYSLYILLCFC